jgi:Leucine-rich repeat (LRR) protein
MNHDKKQELVLKCFVRTMKKRFRDAQQTNILDTSNLKLSDKNIEHLIIPFLKHYPNVINVNLSFNRITDIACNPLKIIQITHLNISATRITKQGIKVLVDNKSITHLDVSHCQIGEEGAITLASSKTLIKLSVGYCNINDAGAIALSQNICIKELNVAGNNLSESTIHMLFMNPRLTYLNISGNNITPSRIYGYAKDNKMRILDGNKITSKLIHALVENTTLKILIANNCGIRDFDPDILIKNNKTLKHMTLNYNNISKHTLNTLGTYYDVIANHV